MDNADTRGDTTPTMQQQDWAMSIKADSRAFGSKTMTTFMSSAAMLSEML